MSTHVNVSNKSEPTPLVLLNRLGEPIDASVEIPSAIMGWYDSLTCQSEGYLVILDGIYGFLRCEEFWHVDSKEPFMRSWASENGNRTSEDVSALISELRDQLDLEYRLRVLPMQVYCLHETVEGWKELNVFFPNSLEPVVVNQLISDLDKQIGETVLSRFGRVLS